VILIDPLLVPGNRYFQRIESLFDALAASGVEHLPAERRYALREQSLRDGITVSDRCSELGAAAPRPVVRAVGMAVILNPFGDGTSMIYGRCSRQERW
jgi:hypothetical protein